MKYRKTSKGFILELKYFLEFFVLNEYRNLKKIYFLFLKRRSAGVRFYKISEIKVKLLSLKVVVLRTLQSFVNTLFVFGLPLKGIPLS